MKSVDAQRNGILRVIGALLCLLALLFPYPLKAESKTPLMLAFGMCTDKFYIGIARNDGIPLRRLTQNGFSLDPWLSPDGRSLFFCDYGPSKFGNILQIYQVDLKTSHIKLLSDGSMVDEWPVGSPDGKKLAFISRLAKPSKDQDPNYRVYISDISGKNRRPADPEGDTPQLFPSWSPDGKKIAYTHARFLAGSRIMIRDLEKKTTTRLTPLYIFACQASWSPRGDLIAYTDIVPFTLKKTIWVIKPDGSGRKQITEGPDDENPFWYPDGSKLLFSRSDGVLEKGAPKRVICSVDLKTGKVNKVVSIEKGSADCPRIIALPAGDTSQKVSQAPVAQKKP
jgi:Tol biopolymer transport system component